MIPPAKIAVGVVQRINFRVEPEAHAVGGSRAERADWPCGAQKGAPVAALMPATAILDDLKCACVLTDFYAKACAGPCAGCRGGCRPGQSPRLTALCAPAAEEITILLEQPHGHPFDASRVLSAACAAPVLLVLHWLVPCVESSSITMSAAIQFVCGSMVSAQSHARLQLVSSRITPLRWLPISVRR